ncbi:MAG: glycosyltransferase family 2 protein [Bacteroidota bacterium]|nr:glycosyltransferase family 2 protein [Bacteroidota bacterium]
MLFSIIIPTYNRLSQLKLALQSILNQDLDDYEVIVVDDGSTDGTEQYLKSLAKPKLIVISQNNKGPAAARNAGIKLSQGKYIAFTDDDCTVPSNWLSSFKEVFESNEVDIIGGAVRNSNKKNIYSEVSQHITNFFVEYLNQEGGSSPFLTSNNIAYRADVLKKVGGFDDRFRKAGGEERALNWKILSAGGKSVYAPDILVDHNHEMDLSGFVKQQLNYGCGSFLLYNVVGKEFKIKIPKISLAAHLRLSLSFFKGNIFLSIKKFILYIGAQKLVAFGFCLQALKKSNKLII